MFAGVVDDTESDNSDTDSVHYTPRSLNYTLRTTDRSTNLR